MKELKRAALLFLSFFAIAGICYPLAVTGLARLLFPAKADGSLIRVGDRLVGSALIGQRFASPRYFHGRPSAADYDASNSGSSNSAPDDRKFLAEVARRIEKERAENGIQPGEPVPPELVLTSASGLDPDIGLDAALVQVPRIARARGLSERDVLGVVAAMATRGYGGAPKTINVLLTNLALDKR